MITTMKRMFSVFLILTLCLVSIFSLSACSSDKDEVRISMYDVRYDGTRLSDYPSRIFTDNEIINIINNSTGTEEIPLDNPVAVLFQLSYYNSDGSEISVIVCNNGEVTFMNLGLPHEVRYLTDSELSNLIEVMSTQAE